MNRQKLTKVFIVDDNFEAIELLHHMLEHDYSVEVVGTAVDAEEAASQIANTSPDLIFLDVELPTMSGLEFCTMIRDELKPGTKVVFYTGHDKYMLEAIRRQAFDYLLKPPTKQELSQIMTRYYEDKLTGILPSVRPDNRLPLIMVVNAMNEHLTLRLSACAFFRYNQDRKVWEIVCMNGETYMLRHRTTSDVILNYSPDLVQIHKRYIAEKVSILTSGIPVTVTDVQDIFLGRPFIIGKGTLSEALKSQVTASKESPIVLTAKESYKGYGYSFSFDKNNRISSLDIVPAGSSAAAYQVKYSDVRGTKAGNIAHAINVSASIEKKKMAFSLSYKDIDWNGKVKIDKDIPNGYSRMSAKDLFSMFSN